MKDFGKDAMSVDNNGEEKANIKRINVECNTSEEVIPFTNWRENYLQFNSYIK